LTADTQDATAYWIDDGQLSALEDYIRLTYDLGLHDVSYAATDMYKSLADSESDAYYKSYAAHDEALAAISDEDWSNLLTSSAYQGIDLRSQ